MEVARHAGRMRFPVRMTALQEVRAPAVRAIAARLEEVKEDLAWRMVERYRDEVVDYRLAEERFLREDVYPVTLDALETFIETLVTGDAPRDASFEPARRAAAKRVHQNVAMESFLHAVRILGHTMWEAVLDATRVDEPDEREAALAIAGHVMQHTDALSTAVAASYSAEAQGVSSDRAVLRRDLLDALIAGQGDTEQIRRLARSLRVRLGESYVVVVIRNADVAAEEQHEELPLTTRVALRRIVEAAHAKLKPPEGTLLVGMRQGEVVALYPAGAPTDLEAVKDECDALARALKKADPRMGFSSWHSGLRDIAIGYAEARDAVEIAIGTGIRGRAVGFDEVLIDHMVRSSPHGDRILDQTIRPLADYDRDRQGDLVKTLRVYLDSGFNLTRAAEVLCVHPNTVVYRLRRVKDLTGRDPYEPDDLLLLLLGLKLTELSCR
jgi:sugar diacid utilization regulator